MNGTFNVGAGVRQSLFSDGFKDVMESSESKHTEAVDTVTDSKGVVYELNNLGQPAWASKPTVAGQYKKEHMWKYGALRASVFKLENNEQLEAYNELLASACGEDPQASIVETVTKFYNGNFVLFITWCPVMYRVLIKREAKKQESNN